MPQIVTRYSLELEIERVTHSIQKLSWYREHGYEKRVRLPAALHEPETASHAEIEQVVAGEYVPDVYKHKESELLKGLEDFSTTVVSPPAFLHGDYDVQLTRYGTGGSYHLPNSIITRIDDERDLFPVFLHESIHLHIEPLIQTYGITQAQKERCVDLIYEHELPQYAHQQERFAHQPEVDEVFKTYYPDLDTLFSVLGKEHPSSSKPLEG